MIHVGTTHRVPLGLKVEHCYNKQFSDSKYLWLSTVTSYYISLLTAINDRS